MDSTLQKHRKLINIRRWHAAFSSPLEGIPFHDFEGIYTQSFKEFKHFTSNLEGL
jgi:hypothetical protein